jgi:hypothetical protein
VEIIRDLRRGGFAVIWDPNPLNPSWPLLMRRVPQDTGDERLIPRREIAAALSDISGMYPLNVRWRCMTFIPDFAPEWGLPVWRWMEQILEQIPLIRNLAAHNVALVYRLPT